MTEALKAVPSEFALFVSAVEGHCVHRFGTGLFIGATPSAGVGPADDPLRAAEAMEKPWTWDTTTIHAFTRDEVRRFGTEYRRAIARGGLKEWTAAEWLAQVNETSALEREEVQKRKDAAAAPTTAAPTDASGDRPTTPAVVPSSAPTELEPPKLKSSKPKPDDGGKL